MSFTLGCSKLQNFLFYLNLLNSPVDSTSVILTKMLGSEHGRTEAHMPASTSGQQSLDGRSPLSEAASKLLYKRMRVSKQCYLQQSIQINFSIPH
jgi:hypothetical protein